MAHEEGISKPACTPNLLPCQIHQDGPVDASKRYWKPENGSDESLEAYFRGRKLKGREVRVPDGYRGALARPTESRPELASGILSQTKSDAIPAEDKEDDETAVEDMEVRLLEENGSFDRLVVWGHESLVEDDDPFVKGIEEWINFSQAMHKPGQDPVQTDAQAPPSRG